MSIEQELINTFTYDPLSGFLSYKEGRSSSCPAGSIAGFLNSDGYWDVRYKGKTYRAHRVAWLITYGKWPEYGIDHKNQVKLDNRLENLRDVTQAENNANMKRWEEGKWIPRHNTSGNVGVYFRQDRQRWRARIKVKGVYKCLGCFATYEEAVAVRLAAEKLYR